MYLQKETCDRLGVRFVESPKDLKLGISLSVKDGDFPIHGLRHPLEGDTCGWYIWTGEYSEDVDFFKPLHVRHINKWNPIIEKYLGLPPGYRFLITPDYEDVWQDLDLLNI